MQEDSLVLFIAYINQVDAGSCWEPLVTNENSSEVVHEENELTLEYFINEFLYFTFKYLFFNKKILFAEKL